MNTIVLTDSQVQWVKNLILDRVMYTHPRQAPPRLKMAQSVLEALNTSELTTQIDVYRISS
jgi:hypothetical protein